MDALEIGSLRVELIPPMNEEEWCRANVVCVVCGWHAKDVYNWSHNCEKREGDMFYCQDHKSGEGRGYPMTDCPECRKLRVEAAEPLTKEEIVKLREMIADDSVSIVSRQRISSRSFGRKLGERFLG
jgi:hypothetical protein